ncbi:protein kinase [Nocardiopsis sp. HNM0947]|uniref:Protein kinase n=1 Tax=Nocardiopsis coralli TaxID=2772213 RepID=A0ABR9PDL2_9ACTN|nr:protein kinase [Nocardiopsis coralli]
MTHLLGSGSVGTSYLGAGPAGERVVVKVIHPELAADPDFHVRFVRESASARGIDSPHTARVLDADPESETPWIATEYVDGITLERTVSDFGVLGTAALRVLATGLARALEELHGNDLVHGDLNPRDVVLVEDGIRLVDFGGGRLATRLPDDVHDLAVDQVREGKAADVGTGTLVEPGTSGADGSESEGTGEGPAGEAGEVGEAPEPELESESEPRELSEPAEGSDSEIPVGPAPTGARVAGQPPAPTGPPVSVEPPDPTGKPVSVEPPDPTGEPVSVEPPVEEERDNSPAEVDAPETDASGAEAARTHSGSADADPDSGPTGSGSEPEPDVVAEASASGASPDPTGHSGVNTEAAGSDATGTETADADQASENDGSAVPRSARGCPLPHIPYKAPEQVEGGMGDAFSDMFALATVLVYAATGENPFAAETDEEAVQLLTGDAPETHDLPVLLRTLVAACWNRTPESRPTSAQFAAALANSEPPEQKQASWAEGGGDAGSRSAAGAAGAVAAGAADQAGAAHGDAAPGEAEASEVADGRGASGAGPAGTGIGAGAGIGSGSGYGTGTPAASPDPSPSSSTDCAPRRSSAATAYPVAHGHAVPEGQAEPRLAPNRTGTFQLPGPEDVRRYEQGSEGASGSGTGSGSGSGPGSGSASDAALAAAAAAAVSAGEDPDGSAERTGTFTRRGRESTPARGGAAGTSGVSGAAAPSGTSGSAGSGAYEGSEGLGGQGGPGGPDFSYGPAGSHPYSAAGVDAPAPAAGADAAGAGAPETVVARWAGGQPTFGALPPCPQGLPPGPAEVSPDGSIIAVASYGAICLWNGNDGTHLGEFTGFRKSVNVVAFNADGTLLASGHEDRCVRVWDLVNMRPLGVLAGHAGTVSCLDFSLDGNFLVSGAGDRHVLLWDLRVGRSVVSFPGHEDMVLSVVFSPDGSTILSGSSDRSARMWRTDGTPVAVLADYETVAPMVSATAFNPLKPVMLTGDSNGVVRTWASDTGAEGPTFAGHHDLICDARFSADGSSLITAGWDGQVFVRDTIHYAPAAALRTGQARLRCASLTRDGHMIVASGAGSPVLVWRL